MTLEENKPFGYLDQFPETLNHLKEWTGLNDGHVIFDSRLNLWSKEGNEFFDLLKDKSNIIIIINDMNGNIFGGFIKNEIKKQNEWIKDENSFLFTLESNERIERMKYEILKEKSDNTFIIFGNDFDYLFQFGFGYDIVVTKQDHADNFYSGVNESSFDFKNVKNPLVEHKTFVISRIVAIQMN